MTIFCDQKLCHREDYFHKKFGIYCSHVWALVNFPKSSSEFSKKSRLFHVQGYKSKVFQLISLKFWRLVEGVLKNNHWKFQVNTYFITGVIVICWKKIHFSQKSKKITILRFTKNGLQPGLFWGDSEMRKTGLYHPVCLKCCAKKPYPPLKLVLHTWCSSDV